MKDLLRKHFLFLAAGLPAFLVVFPLNFLIVDMCGLPKWIA